MYWNPVWGTGIPLRASGAYTKLHHASKMYWCPSRVPGRLRLHLHRLLAEMRHDLIGHQLLVPEYQVIRHIADMAPGDQHASMQHVGVVSKLFDHGSRTAHYDDACVEQFLETAPLAVRAASVEHGFDASLAHVARRGKELRAHFQALLEEPHDVPLAFLHGDVVGLGQEAGHAESQLVGCRFVAVLLRGDTTVHIIGAFALVHWHEDGHVWILVLGGKVDGFQAGSARKPDGRMWLLNRARPGIDITIIVVFPLEGEGAGARPGLDNQVVGLLHAFTTEGGVDVVTEV